MGAPGGRCTTHDLAVGPDGRCVLCRRSAVNDASAFEEHAPELDRSAERPGIAAWARWLVGLAIIVAAFGYVASRVKPTEPVVAREPSSNSRDRATEALVGHQPIDDVSRGAAASHAPAPRPSASGSEHAVPFSIADAPTFVRRSERSPEGDAGLEGPSSVARSRRATRDPNRGPTEEELRAAMRRVSVTMYSTEWCPVCTKARAWLRINGVSFEERDVDKSDSARRVQLALNPKGGVPTIDIDGEVMVGFSGQHMQQSLRRAAERRARQF